MAGIVHFAEFFRWMEEVEHDFMRSLGVDVFHTHDGQVYTWPRVAASCDFFRPVHFDDNVEHHLRVERLGKKSITYSMQLLRGNEVCARGQITAACCIRGDDDALTAVEIPPFIADKIQVAPDAEP